MQNLRRIGVALAVPVIAVAAITFTAHSALSAPTAKPAAAATDQPNQQYQTNQQYSPPKQLNTNNRIYTNFSQFTLYTLTKKPPTTSGATTAPPTTTKTPTTTPTKTPTKTPSMTPSGSASGSAVPSGSASAGGGGAGGGAVGAAPTNCASKQVQPPLTVKVGTVRNAQALVDGDGCTLYLFTKDTATASGCDATCEATWPPAPGPATAVPDLQQQNFTTFARATGFTQTAYFGKQLYYYVGDKAPGDANGQGLDTSWYIVDPSGNPITQ